MTKARRDPTDVADGFLPGRDLVGSTITMKAPIRTPFMVLAIGLLASTGIHAQDNADKADAPPPHWVEMTDSVGKVIGLREDQQNGWRQRNADWEGKYHALGDDPEHKPTYIKLHADRELDLRKFLSLGQYDRWAELNRRSGRMFPDNPPGTNEPPNR